MAFPGMDMRWGLGRRGKAGGYFLLKPAEQIAFGEVLRIAGGPAARLACPMRMACRRCEDCRNEKNARSGASLPGAAKVFGNVPDRTAITDSLSDGLEKIISAQAC